MLWLTHVYSDLYKPLFFSAKVHVDHQKLPLTYNNDMVVLLIWVECAFKDDEFVLG